MDSEAITPEEIKDHYSKQRGLIPEPVGISFARKDQDGASVSELGDIPPAPPGTLDVVLKAMQERLVAHREEIMQALRSLALRGGVDIRKDKLKILLDNFWLRLSDLQWEKLMSKLQEKGTGGIDYRDLLTLVEGKKRIQYGLMLGTRNKYYSYAPESYNAEGLELLLKAKISSHMREVCRGLRMYDYDHNGTITVKDLKKVLEYFALSMSERQFNLLMKKYRMDVNGKVRYRDFMIHLGLNTGKFEKCLPFPTAEEMLKWPLTSKEQRSLEAHRLALKHKMNDPTLTGYSLDQIAIMFSSKVLSKYDDVVRGCVTIDRTHSGLMPHKDFHNLMNYFIFPTSESLFRELMSKMKLKKVDGQTAWEQFLESLKFDEMKTPSEQRPVIHRWDKDPHTAVWAKVGTGEICKCAELSNVEGPLTLPNIMKQLRLSNMVPGPVMLKWFRIRSREGEPIMTRSEFRVLLRRRRCCLTEREMKDLLNLLDSDHTNYITYSKLASLFCQNPPPPPKDEESSEEDIEQTNARLLPHRRRKIPPPKQDFCDADMSAKDAPSFPHLSPEDSIILLRKRLHKVWSNVEAAIRAKAQSRNPPWLMQEELRTVLDVLVMQMTESQWLHLLHIMGITTGRIGINYFLDSFKELEIEALDRWNRTVDRWLGDRMTPPIPQEELEQKLFSVMEKRGRELHRALAALDKKNLGFVSKSGFHRTLLKFEPRLTAEQFDCLWRRLPVNEMCNLDYVEFLRRYGHYYDSKNVSHRCMCDCSHALKQNNASEAPPLYRPEAGDAGGCCPDDEYFDDLRLAGGSNGKNVAPASKAVQGARADIGAEGTSSGIRPGVAQRAGTSRSRTYQVVPPGPSPEMTHLLPSSMIKDEEEDSDDECVTPSAIGGCLKPSTDRMASTPVFGTSKATHAGVSVSVPYRPPTPPKHQHNTGPRSETPEDAMAIVPILRPHREPITPQRPLSRPERRHSAGTDKYTALSPCRQSAGMDRPVGTCEMPHRKPLPPCCEQGLSYHKERSASARECRFSSCEEGRHLPRPRTTASLPPTTPSQRKGENENYCRYVDQTPCYDENGNYAPEDDNCTTVPAFPYQSTGETANAVWDMPQKPSSVKSQREKDRRSVVCSASVRESSNRATAGTPASGRCLEPGVMAGKAQRTDEEKARFAICESKLEKQVRAMMEECWREIKLQCNKLDAEGFGIVSGEDFRVILESHGLPAFSKEMQPVLDKFGVSISGHVNYLQFLQQFVIYLHSEPVSIMGRRHLPSPPQGLKLGSPSAGLYDTLLTLRAPILARFLELKRELRCIDKAGRGWIHAVEFRNAMQKLKIPLSEDKFFFLMEYFDPNLTGHIAYNEFLRVFSMSK